MSRPLCFGRLCYSDCEHCPEYNACFEESLELDKAEAELNNVEISYYATIDAVEDQT